MSTVFEFRYKPYVSREVITLDTNLRTATTYGGSKIGRYKTRFVDALSKRKHAEELQRKHPKRWRRNERILSGLKLFTGEVGASLLTGAGRSLQVVLKALKHGYAVALESLGGLRENASNKGDEVVWKFTMFAYRRLQRSVIR